MQYGNFIIKSKAFSSNSVVKHFFPPFSGVNPFEIDACDNLLRPGQRFPLFSLPGCSDVSAGPAVRPALKRLKNLLNPHTHDKGGDPLVRVEPRGRSTDQVGT